MKLRNIAFLLIVFLFATGFSMPALKPFKNAVGNFSIDFPGDPKYAPQPVDTDAGKIMMQTFTNYLSDIGFMVVYMDIPKSVMKQKDDKKRCFLIS